MAAAEDGALGPFLMFHEVPGGKEIKNRVYFDLQATDIDGEVARLTHVGAKQIRALADHSDQVSASSTPRP